MRKPGLPVEFETSRLFLRAPRAEDAEEVNAAVRESFPEISQWLPWAKELPTVDQTRLALAELSEKFHTQAAFDLFLYSKADGSFLGASGFPRLSWSELKFEIGYWLRTSAYGHGYATEGVMQSKDFALELLKPRRLEIQCDARNQASAAVAERAGFQLERRLVADRVANDGTRQDTLIYCFPCEHNSSS